MGLGRGGPDRVPWLKDAGRGLFPHKFHEWLLFLYFDAKRQSRLRYRPGDRTRVIRSVVEGFVHGLTTAIEVAVDYLGRLYIADYSNGQIYQVS